MADVIIHAAFRNKGYGSQALLLLCQQAAEHGVHELYDDIASDNPAITLFTRCGFAEVCRTDTCITMKKQLLFP